LIIQCTTRASKNLGYRLSDIMCSVTVLQIRICKIVPNTKNIFQIEVFWVVTPCNVLIRYQRFRGPCCLHLQGEVKHLYPTATLTRRHNPEDLDLKHHSRERINIRIKNMRVYPKVSGLAAWSENCKWYSSLPLGAVVSLFCESVW
jgi:hypothetical protein